MTADAEVPDARATALRAIRLMDLTDLSDAASEAGALQLCAKARGGGAGAQALPPVAAVCVWPQLVKIAARALGGTDVKVATVANFPAGGTNVARISGDIAEALDDGAQEIDLVLPWKAFLSGEEALAHDMVSEARATCGDALLKVILETGAFPDQAGIAAAARLAIAAGADFLKTSTGKFPPGKPAIGATPDAARTLLQVIKAVDRPIGLKLSGGIRSLADVSLYLALADAEMGPDWASPARLRIGASSLHGALADAITGAGASDRSDGAY
jgi:deoxyribose-phosphate aldolase